MLVFGFWSRRFDCAEGGGRELESPASFFARLVALESTGRLFLRGSDTPSRARGSVGSLCNMKKKMLCAHAFVADHHTALHVSDTKKNSGMTKLPDADGQTPLHPIKVNVEIGPIL